MNPVGKGCREPRSCHCTPAWARVRLRLKKKREGWKFRHKQDTERILCQDEGRDWGGVLLAKEHQRLSVRHKKVTERHGTESSSKFGLRKFGLNLRLLVPRIVGQ